MRAAARFGKCTTAALDSPLHPSIGDMTKRSFPRRVALVKSDVILERLLALHPKLIDLSLGRIEGLLAALDNPERRLPPVVHVTGTNGKGSTIAFMRSALEAAGYRVHAYTSPHLTRFHERIRLSGRLIEEDHLSDLLEECEGANQGKPITYFEITTAAAFLGFSRFPADVLLLENGLGGRLDATNVVDRPALTVIAPVSIDHTQYLGEGLCAIAGEKAGILKPGVVGVIGRQAPEAAAPINERADHIGAPLIRHGTDFNVEAAGEGLRFTANDITLELPRPSLHGAYQIDNAGLAVAALRALEGFTITLQHMARGLTTAVWPARLQRLVRGPLVARLPDGPPGGWEIWIDAGHNPDAGRALAQAAASEWRDRPLHLIAAMLNSKDPEGFFAPLAAVAEDARCIAIPGEAASLTAEELARAADRVGLNGSTAASLDDALDDIVSAARAPARILICGSHYLVGALLVENG